MKNINIIKVLFVSAFMLVGVYGCEKNFLELDPPYTQDAENYFNTEADYQQALIGAYDLS